MHEISLLENVRDILEEHALSQQFNKITQIRLEIGRLSCVEAEALRFGFAAVMQGSLAENAELIISELDGLGYCQRCQRQVRMTNLFDPCDQCGNPLTDIIQGMEMKIKDLIVT